MKKEKYFIGIYEVNEQTYRLLQDAYRTGYIINHPRGETHEEMEEDRRENQKILQVITGEMSPYIRKLYWRHSEDHLKIK